MAERYVSFRIGKESSLGSEVVPSTNNPFADGTLIFAYNDKYNHNDISSQIVDGRLYVDAAINGNNYRFPINSECSYFLINSEDGKDFEMGNTGRPVYFSGGIPQPVDYISTAYGGTGLTSFTANRMVWSSSTSALSTSGHYVDADHLAVKSETVPSYNFYVNGTSGFSDGHLYLTGAEESSSVSNTTQIVFGTSSNNHVAISSNTNALVINPDTSGTDNQIVLYLNQQSKFPSGITCGDNDTIGNINTNGDLIAAGGLSAGGTASLGGNLNVTGSTAMQGNITITNGNPYVKFIDTENSNQVYYIQGYSGKFAFGPTFDSAVQTDASGNMTLPSGATITPREDNTGSIGSGDYEWNKGFFRNIESEDTFNISAASNISFSSTDGIIQFNQSGAESGRFNGSGELQLTTAIRPAARGSATSGSSTFAWGGTYTNNLYIQDDANNYTGGQFYTTESTSTTAQPTFLWVGNDVATGTKGSRYGVIRLFATTAEFTSIRARSDPAYNKSVFWLPAGDNDEDNCYAVWNPNSGSAVGGTGRPVYVTAAGKVVGITKLTSNYGGTGVTAHTANRLVWSTSETTIEAADNHFVNAEKLGINYNEEPSYNFYVDGTSGFTDSLSIFNEGNITYKINRKKADGSGWAYTPFRVIGNDDGLFANIGVYGTADEFKYMYLGAVGYDAATNVRITAAGSISIPGDQTIIPRTDATGSIGTSTNEWSEGYFRSIKSGDKLYITPSSTLYLDSGSSASIIFRPQGSAQGGFNTSGQFYLKSGASYTATLSGPNTANGTFYFPNTGGTFVTHATRGTAVGGTTRPVYIAASGAATGITATAIAYGGTGATNAANARTNLHYSAATITTTTNDTVANWGAKGPLALDWYSTASQITDQPQQYGLVLNISKGITSELHQLWFGQPSGDVYHRGGNSSGWSGTWKKLLDTSNYATTLNSVYVNVSGDTMTGNLTIQKAGARIIANNTSRSVWFGSSENGNYQGIYDATATYYLIRNTDSTHATNGVTLGAAATVEGSLTANGDIVAQHSSTTSRAIKASNSNGIVSVYSSTNRGLYDHTAGAWIIYTQKSDSTTRIPKLLYLDAGAQVGANYTIARTGKSSSWYNGRDNALIRMTSCNGYSPTISVKTVNGSWEIGSYNNSSYQDQLIVGYVSDTNYSTPTNSQNNQVRFDSGGRCEAQVWYSKYYSRTANYGTGNPGSSTPGNGVAGALYFKVIS